MTDQPAQPVGAAITAIETALRCANSNLRWCVQRKASPYEGYQAALEQHIAQLQNGLRVLRGRATK